MPDSPKKHKVPPPPRNQKPAAVPVRSMALTDHHRPGPSRPYHRQDQCQDDAALVSQLVTLKLEDKGVNDSNNDTLALQMINLELHDQSPFMPYIL